MAIDTNGSTSQIVQEKMCPGCGAYKPAIEFGPRRKSADGRRVRCRACDAAAARDYRSRNREKVTESDRAYKNANRERLRDMARARAAQKRAHTPDVVRVQKRAWEATEKGKASKRAWRLANLDKARAYDAKRRARPQCRLESSVRSQIHQSIVRGSKLGRRTFHLLGYTAADLKRHIERQFLGKMSWDNYGEWHIDHVRPLASFSYKTPDDAEFSQAWSLSNLRPMWAKDNISKGSKITLLL